jgi:lipopolysaccharide transport system permease protein
MEEYVRIIDSRKTGSISRTLSEIWQGRELLYFLVWKDIKVRYKQTAIGAAWAILQPLLAMLIFWFVFGAILDVQTSVPYPIFAYSGLVLWTYFSLSLNQSSDSIMSNIPLLTKVYFPRILLPLALCLVGLLDYAIATIMLVVLLFVFGIGLTWWILLIFIPLFLCIILVSGLGFWLSAVSAKYHDIKYIVPFFIQLLLFVTPIIYPPSSIPSYLSWVITLNPLAAIVDAQRAFVLGTGMTDWTPLGISALISVALFFFGLTYFTHYERQLADVV